MFVVDTNILLYAVNPDSREHEVALAELERNRIIGRVRAGMRRAKLEGRHIGRIPLDFDRAAVLRDRDHGMSLTEIAKAHRISRATVQRAASMPSRCNCRQTLRTP